MFNVNFGAKAPSLGRKLAVLSALVAIPCFATPIGSLSLANTSNGGVLVSSTGIDFTPPVGLGFGDFSTGSFTNIQYNPTVGTTATLNSTTNPFGQIKDIPIGTGPIVNFIQFYTGTTQPSPAGNGTLQTYPTFTLTSIAPGGTPQGALNNCAGVTDIGVSCSPFLTSFGGTSPFVLTKRLTGIDVTIGFGILGIDATGNVPWVGSFTTQLPLSQFSDPSAVQAYINGGGVINNAYSGTFTANAIPEPATYGLLGSGMLLLGVLRRRASKK